MILNNLSYYNFQLKPLYSEKNRSQCFYYQTIPGIHRTGKKPTDIFIV